MVPLGERLVDGASFRVRPVRLREHLPVRRPPQARDGAQELAGLELVRLDQRVGSGVVPQVEREGGIRAERGLGSRDRRLLEGPERGRIAAEDERGAGEQFAMVLQLPVREGDAGEPVPLAGLPRPLGLGGADQPRAGSVKEEVARGQRLVLLVARAGDGQRREAGGQQPLDLRDSIPSARA